MVKEADSKRNEKAGYGCLITIALLVSGIFLLGALAPERRKSAAGYEIYALGSGDRRMVPVYPNSQMLDRIVDAIESNDNVTFALLLMNGCQRLPGGSEVELIKFVDGKPQIRFRDKSGISQDGLVQAQLLK